jgi:negative regulator of sigma E activity
VQHFKNQTAKVVQMEEVNRSLVNRIVTTHVIAQFSEHDTHQSQCERASGIQHRVFSDGLFTFAAASHGIW